MDATLKELLDSIDSTGELRKCHQCGQCSSICPSQRNGGIRTREVMELVLMGAIDPASDDSIWQCTMCNSCTERCQLGVDPASIINALRNLAASRGNVPDHFVKEARLFMTTGLSFPITGLTKKMREEMGLESLEITASAKEDLAKLIAATRLGDLDLE
jgi:heterodisulfide reductase subunit C